MTFSKKNQDKKLPLIEDKFSEVLSNLNTKFVEFSRLLDELKGFSKELCTMQPNQFNKKKDIIQMKILELPERCIFLQNEILSVSSIELEDERQKKELNDKIKVVQEKYILREREIPVILNDILDKEKTIRKRLGLDDSDLEHSGLNKTEMNNKSTVDKFRDSRLVLVEAIDNNEYLLKREKQLEEIRNVVSKIKELSENMVKEIIKSGEDLNNIEKIVEQANENAKKTESELKVFGKNLLVRTNSSRKWWIIIGGVLMIILVVILIITVTKN